MTDPDFDKLRSLNAELRELHDAGELTQEKYDEVLEQAKTAAGDFPPYLQSILMLGADLGFASPD